MEGVNEAACLQCGKAILGMRLLCKHKEKCVDVLSFMALETLMDYNGGGAGTIAGVGEIFVTSCLHLVFECIQAEQSTLDWKLLKGRLKHSATSRLARDESELMALLG